MHEFTPVASLIGVQLCCSCGWSSEVVPSGSYDEVWVEWRSHVEEALAERSGGGYRPAIPGLVPAAPSKAWTADFFAGQAALAMSQREADGEIALPAAP